MIMNQMNQPQSMGLAPGQGRNLVQYLRAPKPISPYPVPQQQVQRPIDPRMNALQRRLALLSKTGDQNAAERSISGKDSMGRPRPELTFQKKGNV